VKALKELFGTIVMLFLLAAVIAGIGSTSISAFLVSFGYVLFLIFGVIFVALFLIWLFGSL
jgi:hypothetical protein